MNLSPEELASLYVLDRLDARARTAFEADLLRNPALAASVREFEAGLARQIDALPRPAVPAGSLAAIEARLDRAPADAPAGAVAARPWAAIARWGLAAVIALSLGTIAVQMVRQGPARGVHPMVIVVGLASRGSTRAELPLNARALDADARFIQLASLAEQFWDKPGDLPVASTAGGLDGRGYALFDPTTNQGFIAIQQLPVAAPGKTYQLWISDRASGQVREAGTLPLAGAQRGLYFFSLPAAAQTPVSRPDFFVTAEDGVASSAGQPHGPVVLGDHGI